MEKNFDLVFAMMEEAFPECEIRTREDQHSLLDKPNYRLHSYPGPDGEPAALLSVWEFDEFRYVEHLAVSHRLRGGGVGGKIVADYLASDERPVILEVELPETEMAKRRIGFYKRLGFALNEYPYEQPPLRKTTGWCPLLLMSYPGSLTEAEFLTCKDILYRRVYGVREEK